MFSANAWHYSPGADPTTSMEEIEKGIASLCPLGRCAVPADIARVVAFLASGDSEWINGESRFSSTSGFLQNTKYSTNNTFFSLRQAKSSSSVVVRWHSYKVTSLPLRC